MLCRLIAITSSWRALSIFPKTEAETERFKKLNIQAPLPKAHFDFDEGENELALGQSLVIEPKAVLQDWLSGISLTTDEPADDGLKILAAGFGLKALLKDKDIPLRFSRGQLTWAEAKVSMPTTYGGYAIPLDEGVLLGATHQRLGDEDPFALKERTMRKTSQALKNLRVSRLLNPQNLPVPPCESPQPTRCP